jgi:hypothetical protein
MLMLRKIGWIVTIVWITMTCSFSESQVASFAQWVFGIEQTTQTETISQDIEKENETEKESEKEFDKEFKEKLYISSIGLTNLKPFFISLQARIRAYEQCAGLAHLTHNEVPTPPPDFLS